MRFKIFNGSLKPDQESNTFTVCKMAQMAFQKLGHDCEIVTMRELNYEGATADVDDELKPHIMDILKRMVSYSQHRYGGDSTVATYRPCWRDWIQYTVGPRTTDTSQCTTKYLER